jgi:iron complex transport system ATP-binding protein
MIEINGLTVSYNGCKVLRNITLSIPKGKVTCIIGPNGAGKTTLLRTIAGHLPYKGSVKVNGLEVSGQPKRYLARIVSLIEPFETSEMLTLTVREALLTSRYPYTRSFFETKRDMEIVEEAARRLRLQHLLDRRLSQLSSGELQRAAIASAIIKDTPIILLDEPDSHIDPGSKAELIGILKNLAGRKTVVFTTHDIIFASLLGEHSIILNNGRIVFEGPVEKLVESKTIVEEVFNTTLRILDVDGRNILVPVYLKPQNHHY